MVYYICSYFETVVSKAMADVSKMCRVTSPALDNHTIYKLPAKPPLAPFTKVN